MGRSRVQSAPPTHLQRSLDPDQFGIVGHTHFILYIHVGTFQNTNWNVLLVKITSILSIDKDGLKAADVSHAWGKVLLLDKIHRSLLIRRRGTVFVSFDGWRGGLG